MVNIKLLSNIIVLDCLLKEYDDAVVGFEDVEGDQKQLAV